MSKNGPVVHLPSSAERARCFRTRRSRQPGPNSRVIGCGLPVSTAMGAPYVRGRAETLETPLTYMVKFFRPTSRAPVDRGSRFESEWRSLAAGQRGEIFSRSPRSRPPLGAGRPDFQAIFEVRVDLSTSRLRDPSWGRGTQATLGQGRSGVHFVLRWT